MGTVTAIGGDWDNAPRSSPATTSTTSGTTTYISNRARIGFDSWQVAIAAAFAAARTFRGVKVNKVDGEWVVSWDAPMLINQPYTPTSPYWQNPWTVTWRGDTA